MTLKTILSSIFEDWEIDFYTKSGNYLLSTYEKDRKTDKQLLAFKKHYGSVKVLKVLPTAASNFLGVYLDIEG